MRTLFALGLVAALSAVANADTFTFDATADTSIDITTPADNWGAQPWFFISWNLSTDSQGLLRFDFADAIPAGYAITSATLDVYQYANRSFGPGLDLYANTEDWSEFGATYSTRPAYDPASRVSFAIDSSETAVHRLIDITEMARGWYADPTTNYGMTIQQPDVEIGSYIYLSSREADDASRHPVLTVVAAPVPEPATLAALGLGALGLVRRRRR